MNIPLFQTLSFLAFIVPSCLVLKRIPDSISYLYYDLKKLGKLFSLFMAIEGSLTMLYGGWWFWFSGVLLWLTATAFAFKKDGLIVTLHVVGATGGIAMGFIGTFIGFDYWWTLAIGYVALIAVFKLTKISRYTFWVEVAAFALIVGTKWILYEGT